jgi:hypothetical protein
MLLPAAFTLALALGASTPIFLFTHSPALNHSPPIFLILFIAALFIFLRASLVVPLAQRPSSSFYCHFSSLPAAQAGLYTSSIF